MKEVFIKLFTIVSLDLADILLGLYLDLLVLLDVLTDRHVVTEVHLEAVLSTEGLQELPCYLVDWGYLKPADRQQLPPGIQLIDLDRLAKPLAQWS